MVPRLWGVFGLVERGWRFVVVVVVLVGLLVVGVVGGVAFGASGGGVGSSRHVVARSVARGRVVRSRRAGPLRAGLRRRVGLPAPVVPKGLRRRVGLPAPAVPKGLRRRVSPGSLAGRRGETASCGSQEGFGFDRGGGVAGGGGRRGFLVGVGAGCGE